MRRDGYLGVDPGKKGAAALILPGRNGLDLAYAEFGEDGADMETLIRRYADRILFAWVECSQAWGGDRKSIGGIVSISRQAGWWYGFCRALRIPVEYVLPKDWQARYSHMPGKTAKARVKRALETEFPEAWCQACIGPQGGWRDGLADAICISNAAKVKNERMAEVLAAIRA